MFIQPDWFDVTKPGVGTNRYSYSFNDPVNKMDPGGNAEIGLFDRLFGGGLGKGDWTRNDRVYNTERWQSANEHNLQQEDGFREYKTIKERAAFYDWFDETERRRKGEVKWPGAAGRMAHGVDLLAGVVTGGADDFLRTGNKMIFDDVFDDLRDIRNSAPLTGGAAKQWDSRTLAKEQTLTQPLWESAYEDGSARPISRAMTSSGGMWALNPDWFRGWTGQPPRFTGNPIAVVDRWAYGMGLMYPSVLTDRR